MKYFQDHKDQMLAYFSMYYNTHIDEMKAFFSEYYEANKHE